MLESEVNEEMKESVSPILFHCQWKRGRKEKVKQEIEEGGTKEKKKTIRTLFRLFFLIEN